MSTQNIIKYFNLKDKYNDTKSNISFLDYFSNNPFEALSSVLGLICLSILILGNFNSNLSITEFDFFYVFFINCIFLYLFDVKFIASSKKTFKRNFILGLIIFPFICFLSNGLLLLSALNAFSLAFAIWMIIDLLNVYAKRKERKIERDLILIEKEMYKTEDVIKNDLESIEILMDKQHESKAYRKLYHRVFSKEKMYELIKEKLEKNNELETI
jgi:hypothetical protein